MFGALHCWVLAAAVAGVGMAAAAPTWVVDPGNPGPDTPPDGRSLFDHLTTRDGRQQVPFPFAALNARIASELDADSAYLGQPVKRVLIPVGRSLQREAAAPDYFASPRAVLAVDAEPAVDAAATGILLRDRLFIAYLEAANVLEVISYNEAAGRFEFQVVTDYRAGGTPQVHYARRVVCIACHQNAAPIFARPLWDETNANPAVADHLAHRGSRFYGFAVRQGIDIVYAIDNATDRANEFALTQRLWQEGCGDGIEGRRCRTRLFLAALRLGLSEARAHPAEPALSHALSTRFQQRWPQGLLIADADIPNRAPLAMPGATRDMAQRLDVVAADEPLMPRKAKSVWQPDAQSLVTRAASGVRDFLASSDLLRIDRHLRGQVAPVGTVTVACDATMSSDNAAQRIALDCRSPRLSVKGLMYLDPAGRWRGRLRQLDVEGQSLGSLTISALSAHPSDAVAFAVQRFDATTGLRLPDGRGVHAIQVRLPDDTTEALRFSVQLRDDFAPFAARLLAGAETSSNAFDDGPLRRGLVLHAAAGADGMPVADRQCCLEPLATAVAVSEPQPLTDADASLEPFVQVCAACHRSEDPFPPNFLAGSAPQVSRGIAQCAERIQFRLAMWDQESGARSKSPMPPHHAGSLDDADLASWKSGLLPRLRESLRAIAANHALPLPSRQVTVARPYTTLRRCLPAS